MSEEKLKMTKDKLDELKIVLNSLLLMNIELKKAKAKYKKAIADEIAHLTKKMIKKSKLKEYNTHIGEKSHRADLFINEVEKIIEDQEKLLASE